MFYPNWPSQFSAASDVDYKVRAEDAKPCLEALADQKAAAEERGDEDTLREINGEIELWNAWVDGDIEAAPYTD